MSELENVRSGVEFEKVQVIFQNVISYRKCSTQLYWFKFIFYSLLALLYLNVQCRANSIWPMLLDESDGDRHCIVQGE